MKFIFVASILIAFVSALMAVAIFPPQTERPPYLSPPHFPASSLHDLRKAGVEPQICKEPWEIGCRPRHIFT